MASICLGLNVLKQRVDTTAVGYDSIDYDV